MRSVHLHWFLGDYRITVCVPYRCSVMTVKQKSVSRIHANSSATKINILTCIFLEKAIWIL